MEISSNTIKLIQEVSSVAPKARCLKKILVDGADINYQTPDEGYTALMYAVKRQLYRIAEYLLQNKANPLIKNKSHKRASDLIAPNSHLYLILKDYELLFATMENDKKTVEKIVSEGALINFQGVDGYSALIIAAEQNLIEIVDFFLLQGADTTLTRVDGQNALNLTANAEIHSLLKKAQRWDEITQTPNESHLHRFFINQKPS